MAYVAIIAEGEGVERAMAQVQAARKGRVQVLARAPGVRVLYDTNMAREFVRDLKAAMRAGKLYVFSVGEPQEVYEVEKGRAS